MRVDIQRWVILGTLLFSTVACEGELSPDPDENFRVDASTEDTSAADTALSDAAQEDDTSGEVDVSVFDVGATPDAGLCTNGVLDPVEEGVDCGGPCPPCDDSACGAAPPTGQPIVHLTFDDGPSEVTPALLDLLLEHDVRATFFVREDTVVGNPELTRRIVAEGHAIGNHASFRHQVWLVDDFTRDIIRGGQEAIEEIAGVVATCARAPLGVDGNPGVIEMLDTEFGLRSWNWDIVAEDPDRNASTVRGALDSIVGRTPRLGSEGVIVLQHDASGFQSSIDGLRIWLEGNAGDYDFRVIGGCC